MPPPQPAPETSRAEAAPDAVRVVLSDLSRIGNGFADLARDGLALLKAESKLFASALVLILVLAVMTGFLLAGATLLLVAAPVVLLVELGWFGPTLALVAVVVMLLLMAALLLLMIRWLGRDLLFRRSRAALRGLPVTGRVQAGDKAE
ncbi:MAG TPA: phage holin family protein [Pseudomonadales bacterium]